jgi:hypothetical protein
MAADKTRAHSAARLMRHTLANWGTDFSGIKGAVPSRINNLFTATKVTIVRTSNRMELNHSLCVNSVFRCGIDEVFAVLG